MGIFGMIFFTRKYDVPMLALVSFFTSGMMFGMKLGKLVQLKATWNKIKKWQAGLGGQPAEGTELGMMDNAHKASCSPHADVPDPSPLPSTQVVLLVQLVTLRYLHGRKCARSFRLCGELGFEAVP